MNSKNLRGMFRTVSRNTGKRIDAEPWIGEYTTAWQPGENSVAEQVADKYMAMDYEEARDGERRAVRHALGRAAQDLRPGRLAEEGDPLGATRRSRTRGPTSTRSPESFGTQTSR